MKAIDRFMEKVWPEPNSGCWLWTGAVDEKGYGLFQYQGRSERSTRLAFLFFLKLKVPPHLTCDHEQFCRNPGCVNVKHMELVPNAVNVSRMRARIPLKTHCPRGHELTEENTRITRDAVGQHRQCRACGNTHVWGRDRERENARARELRAQRGAKSRGPYRRRSKGGG